MNKKKRQFPLPLSSVVNQKKTDRQSGAEFLSRMATPQTAMRNLAQNQLRESIKRAAATPVTLLNLPSLRASHAPARAMVERLIKQGVQDRFVLNAMEGVPRHLFIESGLSTQAYTDASLPIGHQQTISRPYTVARMIEVMRNRNDSQPMKRILEIGTGCGYQAAVLAQVADEVYSIERIKALHELARRNLRPMRIPNLRLHYGDGMLGLPQVAPFDGIVLAAAGMEVPKALFMQLAIGGRLIAPVGSDRQLLQLTERVSENKWKTTALEDCHFVPLRQGII